MGDAKIFAGGLNWNTTDEDFRAFFEKFGDIEECSIMKDRMTGQSRGFGFVVYANAVPSFPI